MEWTSLILFTVLAEAAVGLVLLYWLFQFTAAARERGVAYDKLARPVLLTAWLATGAAMLLSLTHLGWPLFSFRAILGLPTAWLSWEVLLTGLFALGSLALWFIAQKGTPNRWLVGLLALTGLGATYTSGMIYSLPSIPANAGGLPVLLFLATTLLVGAALLLLLLAVTPSGKALAGDWTIPLSLFTFGALLLTGALTLAYAGAAAGGPPEARAQAALFTGSAWYSIRLLVGLLVPGLLLLWLAWKPKLPALAMVLPVLLVVAGELTGRFLFFTATVFTGVNTGF